MVAFLVNAKNFGMVAVPFVIGGDSMIHFDSGKYKKFSEVPDTWERDRKSYSDRIMPLLSGACQIKVELGCQLISFFASKSYVKGVVPKQVWDREKQTYFTSGLSGEVSHYVFFDYCLNNFGLDKSQVSRYMNIADEFADKATGRLSEKWQDFGYSQLVEMLPLTAELRENITPDMTIKEIREYKNSLVATSQQTKSETEEEQENEGSEEKKNDNVFERKAIIFTKQKYPKYERFYGFTAKRLCDKYLELEQKCDFLQAEVERLNPGGTA